MLRDKHLPVRVIVPDQAQSAVSVMILEPFGKHIHRTAQKDPLVSHPEEIRTFPHLSEPFIILDQGPAAVPVNGIRACEPHDPGIPVLRAAAGDDPVAPVLKDADAGVTEVIGAAVVRQIPLCKDRIALILLIMHPVPECKALVLDVPYASVLQLLLDHTGIDQHLSAVRKRDRGSGEAAVLIICLIRSKRCRQIFPVNEIL